MKTQSQSMSKPSISQRLGCNLTPVAKWIQTQPMSKAGSATLMSTVSLCRKPALHIPANYGVASEQVVDRILSEFKEAVLIGVMPFVKAMPRHERQVLFDIVRCVKIELTRIPLTVEGMVLDLSLPKNMVHNTYVFDMAKESDQQVPVVDIQTRVTQLYEEKAAEHSNQI